MRLAAGDAQAALDDFSAAGEALTTLDAAHTCGARALEERARELLTRAGSRPRRPALHGRDVGISSRLELSDRLGAPDDS